MPVQRYTIDGQSGSLLTTSSHSPSADSLSQGPQHQKQQTVTASTVVTPVTYRRTLTTPPPLAQPLPQHHVPHPHRKLLTSPPPPAYPYSPHATPPPPATPTKLIAVQPQRIFAKVVSPTSYTLIGKEAMPEVGLVEGSSGDVMVNGPLTPPATPEVHS